MCHPVFILIISALVVVGGKPQYNNQATDVHEQSESDESSLGIEKQKLIELHQPERIYNLQPKTNPAEDIQKALKTKEIYDKIVEVNRQHGLTPKGLRPNYDFVQIPTIEKSQKLKDGGRQLSDFRFPQNPFSNPILDYLNGKPFDDNQLQRISTPLQSTINMNAKVTPDDIIPGQYVKRKVTHHQTFLLPYSNPAAQMFPPPQLPQFLQQYSVGNETAIQKTLENQTIQNIKSIMNTQTLPNNYYSINPQLQTNQGISPMYSNSYRVFGPNAKISAEKPDRQLQWPLSQYFPIIIRDPFQQMFNAITSMVEYGPAMSDSCKKSHEDDLQTIEDREQVETSKLVLPKHQHVQGMLQVKDSVSQAENRKTESGKFDLIHAKLNEDSPLKRLILAQRKTNQKHKEPRLEKLEDLSQVQMSPELINYELHPVYQYEPSSEEDLEENRRQGKNLRKLDFDIESLSSTQEILPDLEVEKVSEPNQDFLERQNKISIRPNSKLPPDLIYPNFYPKSPPDRTPETNPADIIDGATEEFKDDLTIDNKNNKKVFSKDNTGSGVFIQRLKVRKGGVAIAGPGGIATAGSGGTAIVGPNGYAYTQPDSVAIAGTGAKIVAVDPSLNLSDLITHTNHNQTQSLEFIDRIGKIVAIGPVIYYNRG